MWLCVRACVSYIGLLPSSSNLSEIPSSKAVSLFFFFLLPPTYLPGPPSATSTARHRLVFVYGAAAASCRNSSTSLFRKRTECFTHSLSQSLFLSFSLCRPYSVPFSQSVQSRHRPLRLPHNRL